MHAGDLAAVIVTVLSLVATAMLTLAVGSLVRTMRELRGVLDTLHDQTLPLVADLRTTVDQAGADLERVEGILESAERITRTVDSASQLTYRALSPPLIKTMSFLAGLRRAGRQFRDRPALETATEPAARELAAHTTRRRHRGRRSRDRAATAARRSTDRRR